MKQDFWYVFFVFFYIDGLVQERRNSSVLAIELHLSCTNPLINSPFDSYFSPTGEQPEQRILA